MSGSKVQNTTRRKIFFALLLLVSLGLAAVAMLIPLITRMLEPGLEVGQVASQDYRAPTAITYPSEVLSEQKRQAAERAVQPVYTTPDTSVARQQLEHLRNMLAYISSVRADSHATLKQKLEDLAAMEDVHLSQETASNILALSDIRWQAVQQETIVVLEQVMRNTIRPERLEDARNNLPTLVSLSFPEQQAAIVAELVAAFVAPNSIYSEDLTEAARQQAREAMTPVSRTFIPGQLVVQRGQVLDEDDIEALEQLGLEKPQRSWQDSASAIGLVLLMAAFLGFYLNRGSNLPDDPRSLTLLAGLFLAFLIGGRLAIPGHTLIPYALPFAAYSLIVAALFGTELALVSSLPLAVLIAYDMPRSLELTLYYTLGGVFGVLALGRARRLTSFFWAGLTVSISGTLMILVYRLPLPTTDWIGLASLAGAALFSGLASASLTVLLQFFLAQFLGMTTPMQLLELTRPDHTLLKELLREAPGTYQHSLQVANLAEQAAELIGADPLLTRVGALYHDIGKTMNPVFFIENQLPGFINPHDNLDPISSAEIIIRHVSDGLDLARKHRLPRRITDFIAEHHGTMTTSYQYVKAVTAAGGDEDLVDIANFRYMGPRPQSRETAILMLADGCEARMRAERPKEEDEMRSLVKNVIDHRVAMGQLDDTTLTLKDLSTIADSFIATLRGVYHPRMKYPELEKDSQLPRPIHSEDTVPVQPPTTPETSDVPVASRFDTTSPAS